MPSLPVRPSTDDRIVEPSSGLDAVVAAGAERTVALLKAGIPLSLLLDLAEPSGPDSHELYSVEGGSWR